MCQYICAAKHFTSPFTQTFLKMKFVNPESETLNGAFGLPEERADQIIEFTKSEFQKWKDSETPLGSDVFVNMVLEAAQPQSPVEFWWLGWVCSQTLEFEKRKRERANSLLEMLTR